MRCEIAHKISAPGCGHGVAAEQFADPFDQCIFAHTFTAAKNDRNQGFLVRLLDQMREPAGQPVGQILILIADVFEQMLFPALDHWMIGRVGALTAKPRHMLYHLFDVSISGSTQPHRSSCARTTPSTIERVGLD